MRIGLDIGGTKIEGCAIKSDGSEIIRKRVPSPIDDYEKVLQVVENLVQDIETYVGKRCSIGIGIPGTISKSTGLVKNANSTHLIGQALDSDLRMRLQRPIRVCNDANCFTLSEATDGAGSIYKSVFGVILGTGVGGGLVINNILIDGPNGITGEWGHNQLDVTSAKSAPQCYCGKLGCIESYLSGPGLERDYSRTTSVILSTKDIVDAAKSGKIYAEAALNRYEKRLAKALASVINIVDPDVIVLGGGLSNIDRLYENLPPLLNAHVFSDNVETKILPPAHGDSSGVRGAARLWEE
tara:strand:- start:148 stop:1038 length:891 start_codon:yes stop_codon:yes gene_type:complete